MGKGYLILGEIEDYITGKTVKDTHDERYRQKLARLLVNDKGYQKKDIKTGCELQVKAGDKSAISIIDLMVTLSGKICMIIKYAPGSLVTRRRTVLAASRLVADYQVPFVVVTNGEDAEVIDGSTGDVIQMALIQYLQNLKSSKIQMIKILRKFLQSRSQWNPELFMPLRLMEAAQYDAT